VEFGGGGVPVSFFVGDRSQVGGMLSEHYYAINHGPVILDSKLPIMFRLAFSFISVLEYFANVYHSGLNSNVVQK